MNTSMHDVLIAELEDILDRLSETPAYTVADPESLKPTPPVESLPAPPRECWACGDELRDEPALDMGDDYLICSGCQGDLSDADAIEIYSQV